MKKKTKPGSASALLRKKLIQYAGPSTARPDMTYQEAVASLAMYPTCPRCGAIRMAGSDRVHALFCESDTKKAQRAVRFNRERRLSKQRGMKP